MTFAKKNRPNATVVHAAVTSVDQDKITFYANKFGSFSCLDNSLESLFKRAGKAFNGYEQITVPAKTINTILSENNFDHVDVVSIDIEGTEIDALKGFDIKKYSPRVLVIEAVTKDKEAKLLKYMSEQNVGYASKPYIYSNIVANNLFFCKYPADANIIKKITKIPIKPVVINHPLTHLLLKK